MKLKQTNIHLTEKAREKQIKIAKAKNLRNKQGGYNRSQATELALLDYKV